VIDTSSLSDEQKASADFAFHHQRMMDRLTTPDFIDALCVHEAAHVIYNERRGPCSYNVLKTRITCDSQTGIWGGQFGAIEQREPFCWDGNNSTFEHWLMGDAQAGAAGSVAAQKLYPALDDHGEEGDRRKFFALCEQLKDHPYAPRVDVDMFWAIAKDIVRRQLDSEPTLMQLIHEKAAELRPRLGF
jgi:hypothetical protein